MSLRIIRFYYFIFNLIPFFYTFYIILFFYFIIIGLFMFLQIYILIKQFAFYYILLIIEISEGTNSLIKGGTTIENKKTIQSCHYWRVSNQSKFKPYYCKKCRFFVLIFSKKTCGPLLLTLTHVIKIIIPNQYLLFFKSISLNFENINLKFV